MATPTVQFYFDCSSPWTYLAFVNIQPMARQLGFAIDWRPILVGGVFNAINPSVYQSREFPVPAKAAYMKKDIADWAREAGLAIRFPPTVFPVNSVKAMRGCLHAATLGLLVPFATACFAIYWGEDRDLNDDAVMTEATRRAGLDPAALFAAIATPAIKARLKANTDELIARGGFGSPTMFVGDDMYFGNDRLPLLPGALRRAASLPSARSA